MLPMVSFPPKEGGSENSRALGLFHMSWDMKEIMAAGCWWRSPLGRVQLDCGSRFLVHDLCSATGWTELVQEVCRLQDFSSNRP